MVGEFDDQWIDSNEPDLGEILWDRGWVNTHYIVDLERIEKLRAILKQSQSSKEIINLQSL